MVAFVFADLITVPLLLIYRKYYGTAMTLRLLAVFWAVMTVAGLAVEYLFAALRILPENRPVTPAMSGIEWNYTTWLNLAALAGFAILYWLYRTRERHGGGQGYAKDPVCGMQVETANAPATASYAGQRFHFCSDHCREAFEEHPDRYVTAAPANDTSKEPTEPAPAGHTEHPAVRRGPS